MLNVTLGCNEPLYHDYEIMTTKINVVSSLMALFYALSAQTMPVSSERSFKTINIDQTSAYCRNFRAYFQEEQANSYHIVWKGTSLINPCVMTLIPTTLHNEANVCVEAASFSVPDCSVSLELSFGDPRELDTFMLNQDGCQKWNWKSQVCRKMRKYVQLVIRSKNGFINSDIYRSSFNLSITMIHTVADVTNTTKYPVRDTDVKRPYVDTRYTIPILISIVVLVVILSCVGAGLMWRYCRRDRRAERRERERRQAEISGLDDVNVVYTRRGLNGEHKNNLEYQQVNTTGEISNPVTCSNTYMFNNSAGAPSYLQMALQDQEEEAPPPSYHTAVGSSKHVGH